MCSVHTAMQQSVPQHYWPSGQLPILSVRCELNTSSHHGVPIKGGNWLGRCSACDDDCLLQKSIMYCFQCQPYSLALVTEERAGL